MTRQWKHQLKLRQQGRCQGCGRKLLRKRHYRWYCDVCGLKRRRIERKYVGSKPRTLCGISDDIAAMAAKRAEIARRYASGQTPRKIAAKLGCHANTALAIARAFGCKMRPRGRPRKALTVEKLLDKG